MILINPGGPGASGVQEALAYASAIQVSTRFPIRAACRVSEPASVYQLIPRDGGAML